jgi:hypothetical protein
VGAGVVVCVLLGAEAQAADVAAWCDAMRAVTVQIRGEFLLYRGTDTERVGGYRAGSGFWLQDGIVITAHHVVSRMDEVEVCTDADCRPVIAVIGLPEADVAVLKLGDARAPSHLTIGTPGGPGQEIVAAGFPGDLGFVCGPGHLTGATGTIQPPYLLFEGAVAAEGSSGGPIIALGKSPKKLEAIGAVSGATTVGSVQFNRGAPLAAVQKALDEAGSSPADWRSSQPWLEERPAQVSVRPGVAIWEDVAVPAFKDVELDGAGAEGVCYGFYRPPASLADGVAAEPIAWSCDGKPLMYTTFAPETVRVGIWSTRAEGFEGRVALRLR